MRNTLYPLLGLTIMLATFQVTAWLLRPLVRAPGFGNAAWHQPVLGVALFGAPIAGLLLFELDSGRALGFGGSVIRKTDEPRAYWSQIAFHSTLLLIVALTIGAGSFAH